MLRYRADWRTVGYMVVTTALLFVQWNLESLSWPLYILTLFMAVSVAVIAHNHNHLGIWRARWANMLQDYWLGLFYGFPAFGWIPTHNANHHKLTNGEGDYTATWQHSEKNNLLTLLAYPMVSSRQQLPACWRFFRETWRKNRGRAWHYVMEGALLVAFVAVALILDWKKALLYVVIPQQVSLNTVLIFNYVQHVHCDETSKWNHSRNFVGFGLNAFLFNNGFHTIHHMRPGLHWSETPAAHAEIAHNIDPQVNEGSFFWYMVRQYLLAPLIPSLGTRSMRLERLSRAPASRAATA